MEDEALVRRIAGGEKDAMTILMDRHGPRYLRFFERYLGDRALAEELVVDLFVRVWQAADRFEGRRARATTWMYRIASNLAASASRSRTRRWAREDRLALDPSAVPTHAGPEARLERVDEARSVRRGVAALPEDVRAVVVLRHFHELSFAEVARVLDIPVGTAKSRMHRGLAMLRRILVTGGTA